MAGSEAAKEAIYLRAFLSELGHADPEPTAVSMDNKSGIDLCYNPQHHSRTKHIARRHYFIREKVEELEIRVPFVRTVDNLADFFSKPLPARQFYALRDAIMNIPVGELHSGGVSDRVSDHGGVLRVAQSSTTPDRKVTWSLGTPPK